MAMLFFTGVTLCQAALTVPSHSAGGRSAAFLSTADRANATEKPKIKVTEAVKKASKMDFLIQRVGVQHSRAAAPRSPLSAAARLCLTASGAKDDLDGYALEWQECQDQSVNPDAKEGGKIFQAQIFQLTIDGKIKAKQLNMCMRYNKCSDQSLYDLGPCNDGDMVVTFMVHKAIANSIERLKPLGYPVMAVASDSCTFCGPYMVTRRCDGVVTSDGGCQQNWQASPGWTRLETQYIGDMATSGMGGISDPQAAAVDMAKNIQSGDVLHNDEMNGFGPTGGDGTFGAGREEGICGSFTTDSPGSTSYFYFLNQKAT